MKAYFQIIILFLIMIAYSILFFKSIAFVEDFPLIMRAITLIGPLFVILGLVRKKYNSVKK